MKYLYGLAITILFLSSCSKNESSPDPCNIAHSWEMLDPTTADDPIQIFGPTIEFNANGDMLFAGYASHSWEINQDCNLLEFWSKSDKNSTAKMKIFRLDDEYLEMEMISSHLSITDLIGLALGLDRLTLKKSK